MAKRPFFHDVTAHSDGPGQAFGRGARPGAEPTPTQHRQDFHQPAGVLPAVQSMLYVLVVALFLMTFTVQPIRIPSGSMEPTLLVGDFLLLDKQTVAPGGDAGGLLPPAGIRRGDVVVFHDPVDDPSVHLVKRVIGLPGDRVHLRDGIVYVNGQPLRENYAIHRRASADGFRDDFPDLQIRDAAVNPEWWARLRGLVRGGEIMVPADQYFVLGDNRNDSEDSRYWGFVPREAIVGKPVLVYFSWRVPGSFQGEDEDAHAHHEMAPGGARDFARWDRTFTVVH